MIANPRRIAVPTDYGPVEVALDWQPPDPIADAVQPRRATLTADRIYDGLDWAAVAEVALDARLSPVRVATRLINPVHAGGASEGARRAWSSEAARFVDEHVTPSFVLTLVRAGVDDWLSLTGRRVAALRRRLAEEQEALRGAVLAHAIAYEEDQPVRSAAAALVDAWKRSDGALLNEARQGLAASGGQSSSSLLDD